MAKAQVGDLIRIIKEKRFNDEGTLDFLLGDIYEVIEVDRDGDVNFHDADGETRYINDQSIYEIHRKAGEEDTPKTPSDAVNPQHYKQGRTEVIDIIEDAVEGADPFEAVCQANVLKYTLRYRHKNGVEDLKKAVWYAEKLIAYLEENK